MTIVFGRIIDQFSLKNFRYLFLIDFF